MARSVSFERIAVAANPQLEEALAEASQVAELLISFGAQAIPGPMDDPDIQRKVRAREFDLLIAMGGDGTMLRAGHLCAPVDIPILGINLGHFGFLTEIQRGQWKAALPRLFRGEVWFESLSLIHI